MLLLDKYQIKPITNLLFNTDKACFHIDIMEYLYKLSKDDSFPNLLFYGGDGSGKTTLINMLLYYLFGNSIYELTTQTYKINSNNTMSTDISIKQSLHHLIINPYNNNSDKYIIQDIVHSYVTQHPLNLSQNNKKFKVIVINSTEKLSYSAQMSLRRTMEKYTHVCRFIFSCNSTSKILEPLQSRCVAVRVPNPTNSEIIRSLLQINCSENQTIDSHNLANIINKSENNIKKSILLLELYYLGIPLLNSYDEQLDTIIELISEKSFSKLEEIKTIIYCLLTTNITGSNIIIDLVKKVIKKFNLSNKQVNDILKYATKFNLMINNSRREIIHLDSFIVHLITFI